MQINLNKNISSNQYTRLDLLCFMHSDCGTSPVKTYANMLQADIVGRKIVAYRGGGGSNRKPFDYLSIAFPTKQHRLFVDWELNFN